MSSPCNQSPSSQFRYTNKNSPDGSQNFRSPFPSPRNDNQDFPTSSPAKKHFGCWRNKKRKPRYYENDQQNQFFSPRGGRRGGRNSRGRGNHRGSLMNSADISLYVDRSMLEDPWKYLTELLQSRMEKSTIEKAPESADSTPNDSLNSVNTEASTSEDPEQVTEDSLLTSDTSANCSHNTVEENVPSQNTET